MTAVRRHRLRWGTAAACLAVSACASADAPATGEESIDSLPTTTIRAGVAGEGDSPDEPPAPSPESVPTTTADDGRCDPAAGSGSNPVTLSVWHRLSGDATGFLEDLAAEYERTHPGVSISLERTDAEGTAVLGELAEAGDGQPDILLGTNQMARAQADSGRFVPIVACNGGAVPTSMSDLLSTIERTYTVDGTLWAAPYNVSTPVILYNGNQWEAAGVDPDDPPETNTELVDTIRQLHDSEQLASGAVLYDRAAMWLIEQLAVKRERLLIEPANGRDGGVAQEVRFEDPETVHVLLEFQALYDEGAVEWLGPNLSATEDLVQLIHPSEPTGLTFNSTAVLGDIFRLLEEGAVADVDVRAAPFPGPAAGAIAGGGAWWLVDSGDPARVGASWEFVDWLTQPERIAEFAAYTGYIPTTETAAALPATLESWDTYPPLQVGFEQVRAGPDNSAGAGIQIGPMAEVHRQLELAAADAIEMGADPLEVLQQAQQNALEMISVYVSARPTGS